MRIGQGRLLKLSTIKPDFQSETCIMLPEEIRALAKELLSLRNCHTAIREEAKNIETSRKDALYTCGICGRGLFRMCDVCYDNAIMEK